MIVIKVIFIILRKKDYKDRRVGTIMTPLEALNDLREINGWNDKEFNKRLDIIEKSLKALEIIKEKLSPLAKATFLPMTQEEYELVREVLL